MDGFVVLHCYIKIVYIDCKGRAATPFLDLGHTISTHTWFLLLLRPRQELVVLITGLSEEETKKQSVVSLSLHTLCSPCSLFLVPEGACCRV